MVLKEANTVEERAEGKDLLEERAEGKDLLEERSFLKERIELSVDQCCRFIVIVSYTQILISSFLFTMYISMHRTAI